MFELLKIVNNNEINESEENKEQLLHDFKYLFKLFIK